jgi:hypothetical protein
MIYEPRELTEIVTLIYGLCLGGDGYDSRSGSGLFRLSFHVVLLSPPPGKLCYVITILVRPFPIISFRIYYSLIFRQFDPDQTGCGSGSAVDLHSGDYRFESLPGYLIYLLVFSWFSRLPPRNARIVP